MGKLAKLTKSKKHKKIKTVDPFYVGGRSNDKIVDFNRKPTDINKQEVPRRLQQLMKASKEPFKKKRRKKKIPVQDEEYQFGMTRPVKPGREFVQRKGESDVAFMHRMDRETQAVIAESQLEEKYETEFDQQLKREIQKSDKKGVKKKEKRKVKNQEKLTKKKEMKADKKQTGFEEFTDKVAFGEVAMAPPTLTAKPRKSEAASNRPGKKSLLLKEIIAENKSRGSTGTAQRGIGKTTKRKNMSFAQQRVMDQEREKAIDLYRQMKAKKMKLDIT